MLLPDHLSAAVLQGSPRPCGVPCPLRPGFPRGSQPARAVRRVEPSASSSHPSHVPPSPLPSWPGGGAAGSGPGGCRAEDPVHDPSSLSLHLHLLSFLSFRWEEGASFPLPLFLFFSFFLTTETAPLMFSPCCLHKPHSSAATAQALFSLNGKTQQTWAARPGS